MPGDFGVALSDGNSKALQEATQREQNPDLGSAASERRRRGGGGGEGGDSVTPVKSVFASSVLSYEHPLWPRSNDEAYRSGLWWSSRH